jgi:dihydroorotate dehydrogenase electron transfer subunit
MIHSFPARVVSNQTVVPQVKRLTLALPRQGNFGRPGQFVHLRLSDGPAASILRRPFSIHRLTTAGLVLLYQVKGAVTSAMSRLKPGETVGLMGPLGQGFRTARHHGEHLLVAGGMGLAPMVFLADRLRQAGVHHKLIFGCRTAAHQLPAPAGCLVASDDGSCGRRGPVTALLEMQLATCKKPTVYACGPWAMLRATASDCLLRGIPCQVSLESFMACGVGACQGCAVRATEGGYLTVCDQGPVFDARLIDWEQDHPL